MIRGARPLVFEITAVLALACSGSGAELGTEVPSDGQWTPEQGASTPTRGVESPLLTPTVNKRETVTEMLGRRADALPPCTVTAPNGETPPGERPGGSFLGNGALWTGLWPEGTVLFGPDLPGSINEDGSLGMKFWWWRAIPGEKLTIEGRRLDAEAPPLSASIPDGYEHSQFQATGLTFPTPGCWEVTGRAGGASLTFVIRVILFD
jgi:hypothetical protein